MPKKQKGKPTPSGGMAAITAHHQLPRDALSKIQLGQSFAEYDNLLASPGIFVTTPQVLMAGKEGGGCFFVGRRGTGKTATTLHLTQNAPLASQVHPKAFEFGNLKVDAQSCRDTRKRPFRSLLYAFERAIICEIVRLWVKHAIVQPGRLPPVLAKERNYCDDYDFDSRTLAFLQEYQEAEANDKEWLRLTRRITNELPEGINTLPGKPTILLFDRIDEAWDGSEQAVLLLMALMHACVELQTKCPSVRPKVFLRENIFERVRETDNEFARLETFVVSMDWTQELLVELIERRLNAPFNTKLPLRGPTWDYFFESTPQVSSRTMVFEYCQDRPRDVLTYCKFAIDSAQSRKHLRVEIDDLRSARKRFSDSRLKDLGDEYAENYPQIQLVLSRFFGLGTEFTISGIEAFIKKLLVDEQVKQNCAKWLYQHTTTDRFVHLLYNIGFLGIRDGSGPTHYRSVGAKSSAPPPLALATHLLVHPSYHDGLSLREILITALDDVPLQPSGMLQDVPNSLNLDEYNARLRSLLEDLKTLPTGQDHAAAFEDLVGNVIKLCFFRSLANVEPRVRNHTGKVVRDWIASNRATSGFWEMIRGKYGATQAIWECKNYAELGAEDFQQLSYYLTPEIGGFGICAFRGEVKKAYYHHLSRISRAAEPRLILLLTDKDLATFVRQSLAGKAKEDHIQDCYDRTVRELS